MKCLPAEGTGAAFNLLDFGTSFWQLADRNYTISCAPERAGDFRNWHV
jgi:hypothetical protein